MSTLRSLSILSNRFFPVLYLLLLVCAPAPARAVLVEDLYDMVLPVADESNEVRNAAMADGLAEILVRLSGDSGILQKITPPPASAYVKQYRYEALDPALAPEAGSGEPLASKQIRLQYNGTRVMDFLRSNGIAIWGDHRAVSVVWLAVRDGSNQYVLRASDDSLLKNYAEKIFRQRGLPVVWPAYDKKDQAKLKFVDIWAGFSDPLKQASERYTNGPILAGNMAWNGKQWSSDWTLLEQSYSQRWSVRGSDYEQVLADAINALGDGMGAHYAVLETSDSSADSSITLDIENVNSLAGFVRIKKYLGSLQAVQQVQMAQVGADNAVFQLSLRFRVEDFINLLASSSLLKAVSKPVAVTPGNNPPVAADNTVRPAPVPAMAAHNVYHYRLVN